MRAGCRSPDISPVKWGQHFLSFELFSSDPAILARAETIFHPWRRLGSAKALRRWFVEPVRGEGRWEVRHDNGANVLYGNTPEHALTIVEFLAVEALIERDDTALSLHGALVEKDGRSAVILGRGEAGKSTLTCALWQRGWTPLCDDITLVEPDTVRAYPAPRRVSVRYASRQLLGEELWARILATPACEQHSDGYFFHPDEIHAKKTSASTNPAALIFLQRRESLAGPGTLVRLEPAHALLALLPYSNLIARRGIGDAIRRIRPLADAVPAYDLGRGPLDKMVQSVDRALAGD